VKTLKEEKQKKIISLSFRIDEKLANRIKENADKSNRSQSNFVITLLTKELDDIDRTNNIMR
jgi:predicted HicB family RNase H-like nuclease